MLIHSCHAVHVPRCAVALRGRFQNGMTCVNQTRLHCVNQMGTTQSKLLAARHGVCELALTLFSWFDSLSFIYANLCVGLNQIQKRT
jgi:hypothetical protein